MAKLAIKGHLTRGKEVIQLLEMLGGVNIFNLDGTADMYCYYIDDNDHKIHLNCLPSNIENAIVYTLEEFEKLYPYKVGEKVIYERSFDSIIDTITSMEWENNEVLYITSEGYCVYKYQLEKLPPYKEENMKEPKELIIGFTKDDNGDWVLNTHKDYEIKEIEGKYKVIKKKPQYPKDYEECYKIMKIHSSYECAYNQNLLNKINNFYKLLLCRDAYWKIAGDQMGLNRPWEPDYDSGVNKYGIICLNGVVQESNPTTNWERHLNKVLDFPTAEMRDAFYENFKDLINECKELL